MLKPSPIRAAEMWRLAAQRAAAASATPTPLRFETPATRWSADRLDLLLELLERRGLTATELRILLAVADRETRLEELSELLAKPKGAVGKSVGRLYLRGMLREGHNPDGHVGAFAITTRGLAVLKPLLTASGAPRNSP